MSDLGDATKRHLEVVDVSAWPPHGRADRMARLGVEAVVCGGVSYFDEAGFEASGIRLFSGVAGPADAVIDAFHAGTIDSNGDYWQDESALSVSQERDAIMTDKRVFECADCGEQSGVSNGLGRPTECPACHSENIHRSDDGRGRGGRCRQRGRGRGQCGGAGAAGENEIEHKNRTGEVQK